jgi:hypothetical protein
MTDRIPLDHLTSDQYDALCDELDQLREDLAEAQNSSVLRKRILDRRRPELGQAEAAAERVRTLANRWAKAGPPPLGTPIARWWDKRLAELNTALKPTEDPAP